MINSSYDLFKLLFSSIFNGWWWKLSLRVFRQLKASCSISWHNEVPILFSCQQSGPSPKTEVLRLGSCRSRVHQVLDSIHHSQDGLPVIRVRGARRELQCCGEKNDNRHINSKDGIFLQLLKA